MNIQGLGMQSMNEFSGALKEAAKPKSDDFANQLMDVLKEVNKAQTDSRQMQTDLQTGQPVDIDQVMISMEKASTSLQLTMQVRNKVLEGYQEIMRLQV